MSRIIWPTRERRRLKTPENEFLNSYLDECRYLSILNLGHELYDEYEHD